jgi:hypothetical protein
VFTAPSLGAATLAPRSRRSAARVLMDEGWVHCNVSSSGGDKSGDKISEVHLSAGRMVCPTANAAGAKVIALWLNCRIIVGSDVPRIALRTSLNVIGPLAHE